MFEQLVELVKNSFEAFRVTVIIDQFEQGVLLRFGKFVKVLDPGLHFLWPLFIDTVFTDNVVPTTNSIEPQSLTTRDGVSITVKGIITWRIHDIKKLTLDVEGKETVITDSSATTIGRMVGAHTWEQVSAPEFVDSIYKEIRAQAFRYGVEIMRFGFADLTKCRSLRLWGHTQ